MKRATLALTIISVLFGAVLVGCSESVGSLDPDTNDQEGLVPPAGFPSMFFPSDNPYTKAKAELGRYLFYDTRFSRDFSTSCASCHLQEHAFSDPNRVSIGVEGRTGVRNAPSLTNVGYNIALLWEGGVRTLERQAIVPIIHPDEMDMHTDTLVGRLQQDVLYQELFRNAWGDDSITIERVVKSVSSFERSLVSGNSPFDAYREGDESALSSSAQRGMNLFFGETADCFHCHGGYNFTDNGFHNNGLSETEDLGRFEITQSELDRGKFKTPTLRNIEVTAPYMHDGRYTSLEEVVAHYNRGGDGHPNSGSLVRPLGLSEQDVQDLIAFMRSLTDEHFLSDTSLSNPWK